MTEPAAPSFHWRSFVTFFVVLGFLLLAVSGVVLFVAPPGRIANWSLWRMAGATRAAWQAVHTAFSLLFLVFGLVHLVLNWAPLRSYLVSRLAPGIRRGKELLAATAAAAAVSALAFALLPPVSGLMELGEVMRGTWARKAGEPPLPHAELLTLGKLAEAIKLAPEDLVGRLRAAGYEATPTSTLRDLAKAKGTSPALVYAAANPPRTRPVIAEGGGYGRKTVAELCEQFQVPLEEGLARLRAVGVEAAPTDNARALADRLGKSPIDLVHAVAGE